jgi:LysM repeat protein
MTYPGSQGSQDKPSSEDICPDEGGASKDKGSLSKETGRPIDLPGVNAAEADAWLRVFQDEIASSSRVPPEKTPSPSDAMAGEHTPDRDVRLGSQQPDPRDPPGTGGTSPGARTVQEQFARRRPMGRLDRFVDRLTTGVARRRRSFLTLPRRSQRWVLIAGIAGLSAILWGLFAPSSRGPQDAPASELLAQAQMSNSVLKRQVQHLSDELQAVRTEREQLRNEVDALTGERDWLAARLDAIASAGAPVIEGTMPPETASIASPSEETAAPKTRDYEVGKGDTLWSIARRHNVDVKQLAQANGMGLSDPLKLDQRLVIPDGEKSSVADTKARVKQATTEEAEQLSGSTARRVEYTVKRGDSLYAISRQFDVSVEQLQAWNSLGKSAVLRPSQRLIVYVDGAADARTVR